MENVKEKETKSQGTATNNAPTYEELADAVQKLHKQNMELMEVLRQSNLTNMFKRLDYLFKVIENKEVFQGGDFFISCINEIEDIIARPEETEKKDGDEDK